MDEGSRIADGGKLSSVMLFSSVCFCCLHSLFCAPCATWGVVGVERLTAWFDGTASEAKDADVDDDDKAILVMD